MAEEKPLYYSDYLALDKILSAQHPLSEKYLKTPAHEETLFIIVHQAFELWFVQIRHELKSIISYLVKDQIDDNAEDLAVIVHRLKRVISIFRLINQQFEILETMHPLDFLEFRGLLTPASGFQSVQFRSIEVMLGLQMDKRFMPAHYKNTGTHKGGLSEEDYNAITKAENDFNLLIGLKKWLVRTPFLRQEYWNDYKMIYSSNRIHENKFISDYFNIYQHLQKDQSDIKLQTESDPVKRENIQEDYNKTIQDFRRLFIEKGSETFSSDELSSALFILLYRQYPLFRLPFEFLNSLVEIDELISTWRYKHYLMVKKMIGTKPGTGGSPGTSYLAGAILSNNVFTDLTLLATYFIERDKLPDLPDSVKDHLTFKI